MTTLAELRRNSQAELEKIAKQAAALTNSGSFERDLRYWRPQQDAAGNGSAVIRFLPQPAGEEFPVVKKFSYGFKGPTGRWYIENSPQTIELPCPVNERWAALWAQGTDEAKERAKLFRRRLSFISNILVIKHPSRPEDEGKVFLYEYGKKIYDKIMDKMNPPFPDVRPFNPFDFDTGANFRLRVMKKDGFTNYDKSEFDAPSPLGDDATLERVWHQCHSLRAEVAPDKFKSYDVLKQKLDDVMGDAQRPARAEPLEGARSVVEADNPPWEAPSQQEQATKPAADRDTLAWFKELASQKD